MSKRPELRPIYSLLGRVQRRERAAEALAATVRVALPAGLIIAAAAVVSSRLLMTPIDYAYAAMAPIPLVLAYVALRRRSARATARRIDAHYRLDDRLGNAIEFAENGQKIPTDDPRTRDMAEIAIAEGAKAVSGLAARPVVQFVVPRPRMLDGLSLALLLAALLLPQREPEVIEDLRRSSTEIPELDSEEAKRGVDMTRAEPLREELRKLEGSKEEQIARIANEMLGVLADLESGKIDRAEALRRLDELEEQLHEAETAMQEKLEEDPWLLGEGMRELAEDLRQHEIMREVSEALAKQDAEEVEKELQELMDRAEAEGGDLKKELDKALEEMARSLQRSVNEKTGTQKAMEEAERDLRRQEKNPAQDPEEQERALERKKEKLEELRRQHEREQKAREQLDQLKQLSRQSQGNQSGSSQQKRQDAQKKLSEGAGQASQKSRESKQMGDAREALDQAKSFVQRSGQGSESENRRKQQQQRFAKAAKGQKGKDGKPATMLVEGEVGENGEPMGMMGEGQEGQGEGEGDSDGDGEGQGDGQKPGGGVGPGIGEGSVDGLGDPSQMKVGVKNERVNAKHGKGQTRAEIIETASQEGFATESYRRVFRDYESFAQSAMDSEELPEGQRRRVKRYYQMIQPRD